MTDIAVIILIRNEELHIRRCLERIAALSPRQVFVVDSPSTDSSREIVLGFRRYFAERGGDLQLVDHPYPGYQAAQFNWAVNTLPIAAKWVLRLDADEYLTPELTDEIMRRLPDLDGSIAGVVLKRRHIWRGRWVRHGVYPVRILRLFRFGRGVCDDRKMDEHIVVDGKTVEFECDFVDHSLISFSEWQAKHRGYAIREAEARLAGVRSEGAKSRQRELYYRLPPYLRALAYWVVRYFLKGGFMDGSAGFSWHFWQGLWYRLRVDREIARRQKR